MKNKLLNVAHDIAKDLHKAGAIDTKSISDFDARFLPEVKNYSALQIKRIRTNNKVSQAVFAAYLNTSPSTIKQWEQGMKKPSGISLKMLNLIDEHGLNYIAV